MKDKNKLIADFMGLIPIDNQDELSWYYVEDEVYFNNDFRYNNQIEYTTSDMLPYKESWDWLMPVVEKIQHLDNEFEVNVNFKIELTGAVELYINHKRVFGMTAFEVGTLIDAVYEAIIEFIKWYNKNKKDNDMDTRKCT